MRPSWRSRSAMGICPFHWQLALNACCWPLELMKCPTTVPSELMLNGIVEVALDSASKVFHVFAAES
jgi:hypothetical protein